MKLNRELLHRVMEIAQQMTEVGAEISRVEESITRICRAYGAARVDVYATTSNIIVSVEDERGAVITQTRRIDRTGINMEKLHQYNALVRWMTAATPDTDVICERLSTVQRARNYPLWLSILFYGIIASFFCLFFGSRNWREIITALVVGLFIGGLSALLEKGRINAILIRFLCGFIASGVTSLTINSGFITTPDYVLIGNIMTLIPGVGLTNAMRDLFSGDVISGILRAIEALLFTLAIVIGIALPTLLWGGML